jgi:hypothetical protein
MAEVRELTDEERAWVVRMVDAAAAIAAAYHLAPPPGQPMEPARLDTLWRSWLPDPGFAGQDPMLFINPFGLALGQWLIDRTGLEWRMATDERGTGVAIWGEAEEVLVLPVDVVRKGFESRSGAFFVEVAREVEARVRARREGTSEATADAPETTAEPASVEPPTRDSEPPTRDSEPPSGDAEPLAGAGLGHAAEPDAATPTAGAESVAEPGDGVATTDDQPATADDQPAPDAATATSEPRKRTGLGRFFGRR